MKKSREEYLVLSALQDAGVVITTPIKSAVAMGLKAIRIERSNERAHPKDGDAHPEMYINPDDVFFANTQDIERATIRQILIKQMARLDKESSGNLLDGELCEYSHAMAELAEVIATYHCTFSDE